MRVEIPLRFVLCVQVAVVAGMLRPKEESESQARHVALPSKSPIAMPTYLYNARHAIARLRYSVRMGGAGLALGGGVGCQVAIGRAGRLLGHMSCRPAPTKLGSKQVRACPH